MKTALVVGVREDQTREVVCFGAEFPEARKIVADVATDGGEAAKNGYTMLELHMIGRDTRVKACKVAPAKPKPKAKKETVIG